MRSYMNKGWSRQFIGEIIVFSTNGPRKTGYTYATE